MLYRIEADFVIVRVLSGIYSREPYWKNIVFFIVLTSCKTAPHNRYQPHPAEAEQYTKCRNGFFVLLKMGIMIPETC